MTSCTVNVPGQRVKAHYPAVYRRLSPFADVSVRRQIESNGRVCESASSRDKNIGMIHEAPHQLRTVRGPARDAMEAESRSGPDGLPYDAGPCSAHCGLRGKRAGAPCAVCTTT